MASSPSSSTVQPARLAFLAIYNPSLGPTDETFDQQVVFYHSRAAHEARVAARKSARNDAAGGDALREAENEKLRQIGLAQGMVDFARSFSNGQPVESIETEKSRVVLREVERGWWVLASIDLTRLPSLQQPTAVSSKKGAAKAETQVKIEYSSREVSPPALLLEQLQQAHHLFCLHHGPSLSDLWVRLSREKFCSTLERFWLRYARSWDVLLHGNPAADIFSGLKVSGGGELGFGVGEEEWGSGERDVLEDLTRRTEGLVDLVVSRFGERKPGEKDSSTLPESEALPWMGSGREPTASDGIIFGGLGAIERHSLRDVSLWMRQIYTNGEYAYGIRDNPQRERRKRRRPNPPIQSQATNGAIDRKRSPSRSPDKASVRDQAGSDVGNGRSNGNADLGLPKDLRPELHPRVVSQDHATTPQLTPAPQIDSPRSSVPAPMASAVEDALNKATGQADREAEREGKASHNVASEDEAATTLGIPDQYMKYLTFGLSTFAKPAPKKRPPNSRSASTAPSAKQTPSKPSTLAPADSLDDDDDGPTMMTHLQPMPDGESIMSKIALQKRLEYEGYYVVGLKGNLNAPTQAEEDEADATDGSFGQDVDGSRIVLRTVQVKITPQPVGGSEDSSHASRRPSLARQSSIAGEASRGYRRLRAIIYAQRPFVYCFLFEPSTPSLQYTSFYRMLRQNLMPIHKPLLSSTSAAKVVQRMENSQLDPTPPEPETASIRSSSSKNTTSPTKNATPAAPIFDLIYDPRLLTVHTSIPNIPEPGTPAAEGILSTKGAGEGVQGWTRIEAMNVHSQILNTLASVRKRRTEVERTSKTGRGWWVVWMKVPPSSPPPTSNRGGEVEAEGDGGEDESLAPTPSPSSTAATDTNVTARTGGTATPFAAKPVSIDLSRTAFLVRRATDTPAPSSNSLVSASSSRAMSNMFSNMTFGLTGSARSEEEATGGAGAGWGPQALGQGMGVDARAYVEGLLRLGR